MSKYEFKVVPAPQKAERIKGVKGTQARFALSLETVMNEMGAEGWDYVRTDTLPVEERQGLTGKTTTYQNLLVFRRALAGEERVDVPAPVDAEVAAEQPAEQPAEAAMVVDSSNVTPLRPHRAEADFGDVDAAPVQAAAPTTHEPEEPGNYDGPRLNPVLLARARRRRQSAVAAE
ncbi:MAG: DUF4177 domain-containing protein [Shimia sp.]